MKMRATFWSVILQQTTEDLVKYSVHIRRYLCVKCWKLSIVLPILEAEATLKTQELFVVVKWGRAIDVLLYTLSKIINSATDETDLRNATSYAA